MALLYGVGHVFSDGTIDEDFKDIHYFNYFADAEDYCIKQIKEMDSLLFARPPYLAIFENRDGVITKIEYMKYTILDVNIKTNNKIDEI